MKNSLYTYLVFATVILFAGVVIVTEHVDGVTMPVITTVLGFVTLYLSSGRIEGKVDKVLNGTMDEKIYRVVQKVLQDHNLVTDVHGEHENLEAMR